MSFFEELKRRNVLRVGAAYVVGAWLLIQVTETIFPLFGFGDTPARLVVIVLAIGFIPSLILSWVFEFTPEGLKKDADLDPEKSTSQTIGKKLDRIILLVLAVAISYFAFDKFVLDPVEDEQIAKSAHQEGRTSVLIESYGDKSIAVLAFDDMSPQGDQEYFSDGIAEELLNLLASIKELRVISRSTAFSFKGSSLTLKEIAGELDVTYILEGSVRKSGTKLRITAQLIDARVDTHLWSQTYDRPFDDIFAIQDEISAKVIEQLKLTLFDELPTATKVDPRAFDLYLQARHIVDTEKLGQIKEAQTMLDKALEIEPRYVDAIMEMGRVHYRLMVTGAITGEDFENYHYEALTQLEEINPNSVEVFFIKGFIAYYFKENLKLAARYYEQAMAKDPTHLELLRHIVMLLTELDRADDAIEIGRYLVLNDPGCEACLYALVKAYRQAGRHEEATLAGEEFLRWHIDTVAGYVGWQLGVSWLVAGHPDKALEAFEMVEDTYGKIFALHDLGRIEEFETQFAEFRNNPEQNPELIARIFAWTANNNKAFEWLDKAIETQGTEIILNNNFDLYEKIMPDPRWRALREKYEEDETVEEIEFNITLPPGVTLP